MSTSKIIRLGLIGAGRMGSFHGLTAARHIPGACLAAIADPTPGQAARLAAELGVQRVYTDPQQLLDDPEIDGCLDRRPGPQPCRIGDQCGPRRQRRVL